MLDLVVLANDRPASSFGRAAETAPAGPEDEREQCAEGADGEQDPTDRVDLDAAHRRVDSPDEDRPDRDEKKADSHTHVLSPFDGQQEELRVYQGTRRNTLRRYCRWDNVSTRARTG